MKSTEEVFKHHMASFSSQNLEELMKDFTENSIYISSTGLNVKGKIAIQEIYKQYFVSIPSDSISKITNLVIEDEIVFLEWVTDSAISSVSDGVDTFVIRDGYIYAQVAKYTIIKKGK